MHKKSKIALLGLSMASLTAGVFATATFAYINLRSAATLSYPNVKVMAVGSSLDLTVTSATQNVATFEEEEGVYSTDTVGYISPVSSKFGYTYFAPAASGNGYTDVSNRQNMFLAFNVAAHSKKEKYAKSLRITPNFVAQGNQEAGDINDQLRVGIIQTQEDFATPVIGGMKTAFGNSLTGKSVVPNASGATYNYVSSDVCPMGQASTASTLSYAAETENTSYFIVSFWLEGHGYDDQNDYIDLNLVASVEFSLQ